VLCALRAANGGLPVRLTTSTDASDDALADAAQGYGVDCRRGPLDDVLRRFVEATADLQDTDLVVRITGDNALPDGAFLAELISAFVGGEDYIGTRSPLDGFPYGLRAEVFTAGILRRADREAVVASDREHVTPWIRRHTRDLIHRSTLGTDYSHLRATIDTAEDYQRIARLFRGEADPITARWDVLCRRLHEESTSKFRVPYRMKGDRIQSRLTLGTAQLGLEKYGVANRLGRPSAAQAVEIVQRAVWHGVTSIDTARSYGVSEQRVGRALADIPADMARALTKLSPLQWLEDDAPLDVVRAAVEQSIYASCYDLRVSTLDVLLLHRAAHRWSHGGNVWKVLLECRENGLIRELGASVYRPEEALRLLDDPDIRHLQLPLNVLDRRWSEHGVDTAIMRRSDVSTYARSALLQGALLLSPEDWPSPARSHAAEWCRILDGFVRDFDRSGRADLCLAFVLGHDWVDSVVMGVESIAQLNDDLELLRRPPLQLPALQEIEARLRGVPDAVLDPSMWS
jgi:spore coat polysaccharide biosynthesis protein SpsF